MSMKRGPDQFHDTFREKVASLIQAKQAGETVENAEPAPKPTGAVDLMEALRASVDRVRSPKDTKTEKSPRPHEPVAAPGRAARRSRRA
ncbi:hypothetical protein OG594_44605 [Streptomyces sp. NBC_01214]|uniref:hypothetical protein n=1 Tax=Streptomyces sp. NBC_01214 TaxID=2903777 RepID=UPI0022579444|nr:hypothetical protein [Streptomyces sp. NBC_01214]MCX4808585.1 hypothetical protein [Streptomyces sp. NBC_01214]